MKKFFYFLTLIFFAFSVASQGVWINQATAPVATDMGAVFTIGTSGYIYTGTAGTNFYEFNSVTNVWTAKASFPGVARNGAAGFAIGNYGYVGSGEMPGQAVVDFYEYDVANNVWTQKADCVDSVRYAFSFSIGGLGYLVGGQGYNGDVSTGHSFNPATNQWTAIDSMPAPLRGGFANVVNGKAYCGLGTAGLVDSVFEYDPIGNTWASKAPLNLPYTMNYNNLYSFVVNNKIYVPNEVAFTLQKGGVNVYDPALNLWSTISSFPTPYAIPCGTPNPIAAFTISGKGFLLAKDNCNNPNFWEYDHAHDFEITAVSEDSACEFEYIDVSFTSNLTFNSGNYFKLRVANPSNTLNSGFSDSVQANTAGTYTFRVPRSSYSGNTTTELMTVFSTSPLRHSNYYDSTLVVKRGPQYNTFDPEYYVCSGSAILLYRTPVPVSGQTYSWTSNPWGVLSSTNYISEALTQNTTLYLHEQYTATGCSLYDTTQVIFTLPPTPGITDSVFSICPGTTLALGGTPNSNYSYHWVGSGLNSILANPMVTPATDAAYTLILIDTLSSCADTSHTTVHVNNPPLQTLCYVTVDPASTHNVIVWEKLDQIATDSFYLHREITTNNYTQIAAIHSDSLSEYHDFTANPNVTAYRYKISVKDSCGNYSSNLSPYHNSIHLQYLGSGNLIWNVYLIENDTNPVLSFDVFRDSLANGNWDLMVNVPGTQHTATDINFNQHPNALYRIVANWGHSCTPSRSNNFVLSNIINITPNVIGEVAKSSAIKIYPNPAKDVLMIDAAAAVIESVSIYTSEGRLAKQVKMGVNTLQILDLLSGLYFVEVKTDKGTTRARFIKE